MRILASYHKSQSDSRKNDLVSYYRLIKDEKQIYEGEDEELKHKLNTNNMSLRLSAEAAVQLLE